MWKGNEAELSFLFLCIPILVFLKLASLPFIILLYIVVSVVSPLLFGSEEAYVVDDYDFYD